MKSFMKLLMEETDGQEYMIKIKVRGTDEDYVRCHHHCQWLNSDQKVPSCKLWAGKLQTEEVDGQQVPLRNSGCKNATDTLI